ncbi:MAG: hypothetical protein L0H53_02015 [Candidatus Nitrosocosmicus sp.]|nr:hypothetical protein [Candidatus Nitrosocosmicus sp.]
MTVKDDAKLVIYMYYGILIVTVHVAVLNFEPDLEADLVKNNTKKN